MKLKEESSAKLRVFEESRESIGDRNDVSAGRSEVTGGRRSAREMEIIVCRSVHSALAAIHTPRRSRASAQMRAHSREESRGEKQVLDSFTSLSGEALSRAKSALSLYAIPCSPLMLAVFMIHHDRYRRDHAEETV